MKYLAVFSLAVAFSLLPSCSRAEPTIVSEPNTSNHIRKEGPTLDVSPDKTIEEQVERYMLSLRVDGKECSLAVVDPKRAGKKSERFELELAPPCEFVRTGDKVLSYSYGEAGNWRDVVMFVGGPPYADRKDSRMPNGCGSEFQAVNLYADKVVLGPKIGNERGIFLACPSTGGLDEIYFSEYSLPSRSK